MAQLTAQLDGIAARLGIDPRLAPVLALLLVALVLGTAARAAAWVMFSREADRKLLYRIAGWWALALVFIAVVVLPSPAVVVFVTLVSLGALFEYWRLLPPDLADRRLLPWVFALVPAHYLALWRWGELAMFLLVPVVLSVLAVRLVVAGVTDGFIRRFASAVLGWMLFVWALSFAAMLGSPAGAGAWFVLFVVLTETNDIAASWFGRRFGWGRIAPRVSPKKTWTGTIGGIATTLALSLLLTPWLTGRGYVFAAAAGLLVGVVGFFSDLTVSAIKRDVGVKDAGELLPEQGGVLDRADSAVLTAPLFYALVRLTEIAT